MSSAPFSAAKACSIFWADQFHEDKELERALSRISRDPPLPENFAYIVKICRGKKSLHLAKALHVNICNNGMDDHEILGNSIVVMFIDCKGLDMAQQAFNKLEYQGEPSWTALLQGYIEDKKFQHAFELYKRMMNGHVHPSKYTFLALLKACARIKSIERGYEIERDIMKWKLDGDLFLGNALVDMYAKCGSLEESQRVFDKIPIQDVVSWNALLTGYAEKGLSKESVECLGEMQMKGILPNPVTYLMCLKACGSSRDIENGLELHTKVTKLGLERNGLHGNTLLDMYGKCGAHVEAQSVFNSLNYRDVVSWTVLVSCYVEQGLNEKALSCLKNMQLDGVSPNAVTFICSLRACANMVSLQQGHEMHNHIISMGFEKALFIGNTLLDMYAKCGSVIEAHVIFDDLAVRDVVSWSALIAGYADLGLHQQALDLFEEMQLEGINPNEFSWNAVILGVANQEKNERAFNLYLQMQEKGQLPDVMTFASVLKAFGNATTLQNGKRIHSQVYREVFDESEIVVATALIDMYGKCGGMIEAQEVFDSMQSKDLVAWSAMITGYTRQGEVESVFSTYERMQDEGVQPDEATFLIVLNSCSHVGLVDKGWKYFESMSKANANSITIKHLNCMVDLLGRAGRLEETIVIHKGMPFTPDISTCCTILNACRIWGNIKLGRHIFEDAIRSDRKHQTPYILMYNIYADAHMWKKAKEIQEMYAEVQGKDVPGQSWINIDGYFMHI